MHAVDVRNVLRDGRAAVPAVVQADAKTDAFHVRIHDALAVGHEFHSASVAKQLADGVDDASADGAQVSFFQAASRHLPVLDVQVREFQGHVRQNHGPSLLPRPVLDTLFAFERVWDLLVRVQHGHAQLLDLLACEPHAVVSHEPRADQGVLHNGENGLVVLRVQDLVLDEHQFAQLCAGLFRLRQMHVHFVAVKIAIVSSRAGQAQAQRFAWLEFHFVRHQGLFAQGRLAVEHDPVSVAHVALHFPADAQLDGLDGLHARAFLVQDARRAF